VHPFQQSEKPAWGGKVAGLLGTRLPLILGPMRLITLGKMAAAVSNAGGFGQIAASGLEGDNLREELKIARELTDKPVGVNIPVYRPNAFEAIEIAIEMGVKTITTSAGNPAKIMGLARSGGLTVIHKVSSVRLAQKAQDAGVDAVIAMGYEAGGHVGRENITTFCLIPQIADAVSIPVIAAGGIADARGVVAAMALGASGVEMGTRFVACKECPVPSFFKEGVQAAQCDGTLLLGKEAMPIRVLANSLAMAVSGMQKGDGAASKGDGQVAVDQAMTQHGDAAYVMQGGNRDSAVMPCGQIAGLVKDEPEAAQIIAQIEEQVLAVCKALGGFFNCA